MTKSLVGIYFCPRHRTLIMDIIIICALSRKKLTPDCKPSLLVPACCRVSRNKQSGRAQLRLMSDVQSYRCWHDPDWAGVSQRPPHWPSHAPLATLLWQHQASTSGLQTRVSDQQWSRHQGMLEGSWGNGSWSYLHSLPRLGHDDYECSDQCNIQQHPAARGPRHGGVCGEWRVAASTRRDRNRSRTSWCRGLGGLVATWPDMNTLDLNGSVSYEFVSTSAIQRLAAWIHIWALSGWLGLRYWPTQNMRHAVSKYNDWHPMYYSAYFTVLAPYTLLE